MSFAPKKRKFAEASEPDESSTHQGRGCIANNCPLVGSISNGSGGPFHCWAHDRLEESSQWPFLTQGINENLWLFKVADRVATLPLYDLERKQAEIAAYLAGRGMPELARMKNDGTWSERISHEPRSAWVGRLRNAAYKAAFDYVMQHWFRSAA